MTATHSDLTGGWSGAVGQRRAFAEAGQVDRDHIVAGLKRIQYWLPGAPGESEPVHQDERRPGSTAVARERRVRKIGASGT